MVAYVDDKRLASSKTLDEEYSMLGTPTASLASDYDGDGVPELYVHTFKPEPDTGGHVEAGELFTIASGAVAKLAATAQLRDIGTPVDVDGDGLLDLPTSAGIRMSGEISCKAGMADWKPARFIAHAQPGGRFSLDDAVAKKFALAWCPSPPANITTPADAVCAHLWSTPEAAPALAKRITCTPWDCKAEAQGKPQLPTAARDCASRADALTEPVPFTLR